MPFIKNQICLTVLTIAAIACSPTVSGDIPYAEPSPELSNAFRVFQDSVAATMTEPLNYSKMVNLHSLMVLKDGSIVLEKSFSDEWPAERPHPLFSVSKTFTATAVGLAIGEGKLSLQDRVADFFPDLQVPDNPCDATVEDLLMMAGGHDTDPTTLVGDFDLKGLRLALKEDADIARVFFSHPFIHKPGIWFCYNSLGSHLLSAIVQQVTGETVLEYLTPRLFGPLGIDTPEWETDAAGVSCGGWGLYLRTKDMAKFGQLLLQKGRWGKTQIIPSDWVETMGAYHIDNRPPGMTPEEMEAMGIPVSENEWAQGYGYQMWRSTHNGYRADGALGQIILVLPDKNAVIVLTAMLSDTQLELGYVWKYLYPAL